MGVVFQYTNTVKICIGDIASYLRRIEAKPKEVITAIIEQFEKRVSDFPWAVRSARNCLK